METVKQNWLQRATGIAALAALGTAAWFITSASREDIPADSKDPGSIKIGLTAQQMAQTVLANRFQTSQDHPSLFARTDHSTHYDTYTFARNCPVVEAFNASDAAATTRLTIVTKFYHKQFNPTQLTETDISDVSITRTGTDDGYTVAIHKGPNGWSYEQSAPTEAGMFEQGYQIQDLPISAQLSLNGLTTALAATGQRFTSATTTSDCGPALSRITQH